MHYRCIISSNDETERQCSSPGINVVLTPKQIEALLYYTTYPKHFFRDMFTPSKSLYAYVINSYFNKGDGHEHEHEE